MANKFKITMKNGSVFYVETKWMDLCSIEMELNNCLPYARIGGKLFAKDAIASVEKIEEEKLTEEKENEHE